ncbi:hypothetical protein E2C01_027913 [Portunus trituberculatus]|uniref:Uncharacterized protein n=1 Tax=Portunus trituberculatus TaxID=210409 RepID=A0A5B7EJY1_PORTR|nr:hypothetical protein [Portunus trituberculatus]
MPQSHPVHCPMTQCLPLRAEVWSIWGALLGQDKIPDFLTCAVEWNELCQGATGWRCLGTRPDTCRVCERWSPH